MAAKKTKKTAAAKKPAKKKAPAKKAAKAAKAAAKKPAKAAKKAAPKKAAPKKAAPKPAAKKKPAKQPAPPKPAKEPIEVVETTGGEPAAASEPNPSLQTEILAMARQLYGDRTDEELLALDPNDIDTMDPSMFYELLGEKYGVQADPDNDYFGGFGGPIRKTIEFVESRWDGRTRKDTPMPPGDWLEEYVHPETENR